MAGPDVAEPEVAEPELLAPRRSRVAPIAVTVAAVVVLGLVVLMATRPAGSERQTSSALVGQLAPAIHGTTLDGGTVDIDRYRGRWVLVNFFATWCIPCIEEHPELVEFHERHAPVGDAAVISVVIETPEDEARRFFAVNGGDWPVVLDPEGRTSLAYGMVRVPETFLVAPDGTVVRRLIGGVTAADLDRLLDVYTGAVRGGGAAS
jgi:cytochrome c biogenesis protein CcmG, thiol:disulfide interchange protein DsbE